MTVDVLMPVYSTPVEWVKEALASIRGQSYKDFTLVIVDDNNPPGPLRDLLYEQATCKCKTVIIRTEENRGLAATLNAGLSACTGDIVIRMDADDIAHRDLVAKHVEFFTKFPKRQICGVQIRLFSTGRTWKSHHPRIVNREMAYTEPGFWFVNHPGVAYRRETVLSLGGYGDIPASLAEDYALWIKFLKAGHFIHNQEEILVDYRVHQATTEQAPNRHAVEWCDFLKQQKELLK